MVSFRTLRAVALVLILSSSAFARARTYGYCNQGGQAIVTGSTPSSPTTPVQRSYPQCVVSVFYTGGAAGSVTTSGTTVTLATGTYFNANSGWPGLVMTINSVPYTIASVTSPTVLVLTASAGTQASPVAYSMPSNAPAAIYSDNAGTVESNPFTSSNTGYWYYYADDGTYDATMNGGGIPAPFTWGAISSIDPNGLLRLVDTDYPGLTLQQLITRAGSGTLYLTVPYTVTGSAATITTSLKIQCQGAGSITTGGNFPTMIISGSGVTVDGCPVNGGFATLGFRQYCIAVTGVSYVTIKNSPSISNCGIYGIFFDGSSVVNQHVKVLNNVFTANQEDAVYSQGLLYDAELAGNYADGSTNAEATHTFAVHYQQAGTTPPHAINIHDNVEICGPYFCNEIGSFIAPNSMTSWPYDVHLSHNTLILASGPYITSPGFDSLSDVQGFTLEGEIEDAQGIPFNQGGPEIIGVNGIVHGTIQENCAADQILGINLNQSADIDVSGNNFCAQVLIGIDGPGSSDIDIDMTGNRFHDNSVTLQSGYVAAAVGAGYRPAPIWVQLNDPLVHMSQLDIHDNVLTGLSTSDGTVAVILEDDPCTNTSYMDQVFVHHNTFNAVQYGLADFTNCPEITNVDYSNNIIGSGTAQFFFNATFGSIIANNFGFGPYSAGFTPTCTNGAGTNGTGTGACTAVSGSYTSGYVQITAAGTPAAAPSTIFTLAVPSGVFIGSNALAAHCVVTQLLNTSDVAPAVQTTTGSATSLVIDATTTTLIATHTYLYAYNCN